MKYKFNKIFSLLIKSEENAWKPYLGPDLCLLAPNLGLFFFFEVSLLLDVAPTCIPVQYQRKLMIQTKGKAERVILVLI